MMAERDKHATEQQVERAQAPMRQHAKEHTRQEAAGPARQRLDDARNGAFLTARDDQEMGTAAVLVAKERRHAEWVGEQGIKAAEAAGRVAKANASRAEWVATHEKRIELKDELTSELQQKREQFQQRLLLLSQELDLKQSQLKGIMEASRVASDPVELDQLNQFIEQARPSSTR